MHLFGRGLEGLSCALVLRRIRVRQTGLRGVERIGATMFRNKQVALFTIHPSPRPAEDLELDSVTPVASAIPLGEILVTGDDIMME